MSVVLRTIRAFPRGRTIEELHALLGTSFRHEERMALLAELDSLAAQGRVRRLRSGRWIPLNLPPAAAPPSRAVVATPANAVDNPTIVAAPFTRSERASMGLGGDADDAAGSVDPGALLRYWRSALRADPRGSITEAYDRHGALWHLVSGRGPIAPEEGNVVQFRIDLDALAPDFRAALLRREANENTLAIGWPIAVGRRSGVPAIWPVGLIAAEWRRADGFLEIDVSADDVLVNPDWLRGAARSTSWRSRDLEEVFAQADGVGLECEDFLSRLSDAAAGQIRGKIIGDRFVSELDTEAQGIFDAAALFLPDDSTFTAGAVRDLDAIATWPTPKLSRTALAPLLGLQALHPPVSIAAINVGPLNAEQITAVRNACSTPLSVVTGPPGTGKSQAIVSMAASVLAAGGTVLVASKNHQALDAVQDRLGGLAPDMPFFVRTLDPSEDVDRSFMSVLTELVQGEAAHPRNVDETLSLLLREQAGTRAEALDGIARRENLECAIAELLERIEARKKLEADAGPTPETKVEPPRRWTIRLVDWFRRQFGRKSTEARGEDTELAGVAALSAQLAHLRAERDGLTDQADVIGLTEEIAKLTRKLLPAMLSACTTPSLGAREALDQAKADYDFMGSRATLHPDLTRAVLKHRPLWLASVLGAPKRLPLEEGLFDLVIFDEASQCDIASALPLFARARRAVVVGDSRQLNFIAHLGQTHDRNLMQAQGLPVARMSRYAQSRQSLFDFARRMAGAHRVMLRQQYRSVGPIVEYISREFYGSELKTAYDPSTIRTPASQKPGLAWTHVPAPALSDPNNVNRPEVSAIVAHISRLLMEEGYDGTIGVTSPFRGQVHAIEQAVRGAIPSHKLEAAEFRVATVDGFQGQERDVILFSPTLGATSRMTAVGFVQKDHRRLNVAISRARAVAHVFGDLDFARSRKVKTLAALAAAATEPKKRGGEGTFDSDWERIVYHALISRGFKPMPQYEIAGRRLDFALFGSGGIKLDLEVDGRQFHETADGRRKLSDYWRDHQLKSLGWRVRRFWVDDLARNMEACLDLVERDLS
jgi:very-short-patch-repair endonuclease